MLFMAIDVKDPLTEEKLCDWAYNYFWLQKLQYLYTTAVVLSAIQVRRVYPEHRINSVTSKAYVYSGIQSELDYKTSLQDYGIKMSSVFLKGGLALLTAKP
jgi:hypothetical protein